MSAVSPIIQKFAAVADCDLVTRALAGRDESFEELAFDQIAAPAGLAALAWA